MQDASRIRLPKSLTAPDAFVAILVALFLQYKQYSHRRQRIPKQIDRNRGLSSMAAPTKFSLLHQILFTNLSTMEYPLSKMASQLDAKVVDLQSEQEVNKYTKALTSDRSDTDSRNKSKKQHKIQNASGKRNSSRATEVRSRRIKSGELIFNNYFPAVESVFNLSFAIMIGISCRWIFGVIRSLRLSRLVDGVGGICCSSYNDNLEDQTESFERLLACLLIKREGDEAGSLLLSLLLIILLASIFKLAWSVSLPESFENAKSNKDEESKRKLPNNSSGRINTLKVRLFFTCVGSVFSALWLFHTPALLRSFGLAGLVKAVEEFSARIILLGNLVGVFTIPKPHTHEDMFTALQNLTNFFLFALAFLWGLVATSMMIPIKETARNAAIILSSASSKSRSKKMSPDEMVALMNVRIMFIIQSLAPCFIICTYFIENRFAESMKKSISGGASLSFSKQYFHNSGMFVRKGLALSFLGASVYTFRAMLQSYLNQAVSIASALAVLSDGASHLNANPHRSSGNKRTQASIDVSEKSQSDPFRYRYERIVLTAGRIIVFPAFIFTILVCAHLRGGEGSMHPGLEYNSQNPSTIEMLGARGLMPPYSGQYMLWIANKEREQYNGSELSFLQAAAMSQKSWGSTSIRDSTHRKIVDWFGKGRFCYPPEQYSIKSMGRYLNALLKNDNDIASRGSIRTLNFFNGRQLLDMSPPLPYTLFHLLFRQLGIGSFSNENEICSVNISVSEEKSWQYRSQDDQSPSIFEAISWILSHNILTTTVVFPIVETFMFLSSVWWTIWYTVMLILYLMQICKSSSLHGSV